MNRGLILGALACLPMLVGCVGSEDSFEDAEFRAGAVDNDAWWAPNPEYPGDGEIEVREGAGDDLPDTILWDFDGGSVSRTRDGNAEVLWIVEGNELWTADASASATANSPVCTVVQDDHPSGDAYQLVDDNGEVIFTMWRRYVFAGDIDLPAAPQVKHNEALQEHLALSFKKKKIFAGAWWCGTKIAKADEKIAKANPMRRLLLAAMVSGECGA